MKKKIEVFLLILILIPSLISCGNSRKAQRLDEIRSMIIGDEFIYTDKYDSSITRSTLNFSGTIEFYEDGTFFQGTIKQRKQFNDDGELIYYMGETNTTYRTTEKLYGTFELKYDEEETEKIKVVLNIMERSYEKYDGSKIIETENDENYSETKEYTVHLTDNLVEDIGGYSSLNYAGHAITNTLTGLAPS